MRLRWPHKGTSCNMRWIIIPGLKQFGSSGVTWQTQQTDRNFKLGQVSNAHIPSPMSSKDVVSEKLREFSRKLGTSFWQKKTPINRHRVLPMMISFSTWELDAGEVVSSARWEIFAVRMPHKPSRLCQISLGCTDSKTRWTFTVLYR